MPSRDSKRNQYGNYNNHGHANGRQGGAPRNHVIPSEPPFTAYIGNAPDSMVQGDFENHLFIGLKVKQVRLVRDRQTDRFRGFAYVDFEDEDSLRRAIELDGTCINDRPIRIDVAARPLGATKPEGFRNKPGFESRNGRRPPSGNNNNHPNDRYRQGNNYNQPENSYNADDEAYTDGNYHQSAKSGNNNEHHQHQSQARKISNDDVFIGPDTPTSNEDHVDQTNAQQETSMVRQQSRNWADCPIDETAVEPSPPASADNTFTSDDFQVVRNKNPRSRTNQQGPSRPMGNQYNRNRNNGNNNNNNNRGGTPQMSGGRNYYEQMPSQYSNHSQQYYHQQHTNQSHNTGSSYRTNDNHNRPQQPARERQRLNSNRSNTSRGQNDNYVRTKTGNSESSNDMNNNPAPAENRPRLQLLPRSQKLSSSTDDNQPAEALPRNASIFGSGKPRDERDPKVAELSKHIEEVVEKEQHIPRTTSTTSNGSTDVVIKPVRILTAAKNQSGDH